MRVGSIVFSTHQGLGILAKSFFDNGIVTDILIVEHSSRINNHHWYPTPPNRSLTIDPSELRSSELSPKIRQLIDDVDVMLFFETPFDWRAITYCRERGKKTFFMPMYECTPKVLPATPDFFICPSLLETDYFKQYPNKFIPVPVEQKWKFRGQARVFIHNAGNLGLRGRNGTLEFLSAIHLVKNQDIRFIVRAQEHLPINIEDPRLTIEIGTQPYDSLYSSGDVFVFPEKFNGLSLPLQEAYAAGMLVMTTKRYPMTSWLPTEPMIPFLHTKRACVGASCLEFNEAIVFPKHIAETIDQWAMQDISEFSLRGLKWSEENSWRVLKQQYLEVLQ